MDPGPPSCAGSPHLPRLPTLAEDAQATWNYQRLPRKRDVAFPCAKHRQRERVTRRRVPCDRDAPLSRDRAAHAPQTCHRRPEGPTRIDMGAAGPPRVSSALDRWACLRRRRLDAWRGGRLAHDVPHRLAAHRRASSGGRRRSPVPLGAASRRPRRHRRSQTPRDWVADLALHLRRLDGGARGEEYPHPATSHRVCLRDGDRVRARRAALASAHRGDGSAEPPARGGHARRCR
jgi:hypothetical protein